MPSKALNISNHQKYIDEAVKEAQRSTCGRRLCGSVVVKDEEIIGRGFNSPPANDESQRRCDYEKSAYHHKVTDRTCCIHAEERAIMDALASQPEKLKGATLYFVAVDRSGKILNSGKPYCTICSKMALDSGISYFVLHHKNDELTAYDTTHYNQLSYEFEE